MTWTYELVQRRPVDLGICRGGSGHRNDVTASNGNPADVSWQRLLLEDVRARAHVAIAVHDPEGDVVPVEPLVIVDGRPVEDAPNVNAAG